MKEEIYPLNLDLIDEVLLDLDFKTINDFLGITNANKAIFPHSNFQIDVDFIYPLIRKVNEELLLIVDVRAVKGKKNGYLFNYQGKLIRQFYAGDGIEDVKIIKEKIIISYFDEGVFGVLGPNNEGLSIFNLKGEHLFGYNEKHGELRIVDCYAITKFDNQSILFFAYSDFVLVKLNLITYEEELYKVPSILRGSTAITNWKNKVFFYSPYDDKGAIYQWKFGAKTVNKVGNHNGNLKGFENGYFINFNKGHEYCTIINMR